MGIRMSGPIRAAVAAAAVVALVAPLAGCNHSGTADSSGTVAAGSSPPHPAALPTNLSPADAAAMQRAIQGFQADKARNTGTAAH